MQLTVQVREAPAPDQKSYGDVIYELERKNVEPEDVVRWLRHFADGIEADLESSSPVIVRNYPGMTEGDFAVGKDV